MVWIDYAIMAVLGLFFLVSPIRGFFCGAFSFF
ncbi:bacteriocin production protein, partial [Klebsiella pneumoniae]